VGKHHVDEKVTAVSNGSGHFEIIVEFEVVDAGSIFGYVLVTLC